MNSTFNTFYYFTDFLIISIIVLPLFFWTQKPVVRRMILILTTSYLLFVIAPRLLLFYFLFWLSIWIAQISLATKQRSSLLIILIIIFLAPLIIWKLYPAEFNIQFNLITHQLLKQISQRLWEIDAVRHLLIPIGFSFATFRAIDLLIQTHLGLINTLTLDRILYFGFFPPALIVGPIIEYREIELAPVAMTSFKLQYLTEGITRIIIGMTKIFVLAYPLQLSSEIFNNFDQNSSWIIWSSLFLFSWFFYLNFAGYADIAIGSARLYGFRIQENFNFPYFQPNIQAFWANWHISLTRFAQRNVFIPLGGFRPKTQYFAIIATIMVIALWHDLSFPLILFGCYHGFALCIHRYWDNRRKALKQKPTTSQIWIIIKQLVTFLFVMLGFPLMMLPISQIMPFYLALLGY